MRRLAIVAVLAALALVGTAGPATAHNTLISSDPAEGAALDTPPSSITLTFDQEVQDADVNEVAVTGPGGGSWAEGSVRVERNVVTAPVRPLGPAGEYVIGFRVLSADGHTVSKEIRFTLTKPGPGADSAAPASSAAQPANPARPSEQATETAGSQGIPVWVWIVAAAVLLAVGVTVALRMGSGQEDR
ncbi:copper resistance protein CopC [Prauserella oleivorans]|uniref:Copper resistance protein CopC n=1 Tax=Prauserella oleivorans TaxID=1478153 RepID=A0ABW5WIU6_9PSEU